MQTIELCSTRANDRIALRGVRLRARLAGMAQRTVVEQTFVNLEPRAIEAIYTFPLPEGAAVCGFEVITADRVLTGTIEEANEAVEKYDDAISEGHGAFIVEQERPDVFTARIGNIKPHQAATIRLTYVCALDRVDRQIRVAFPTTLAPRYVTSTGTDPIGGMIDGDALNPPHVLSVPYGLTIDVEVDLGWSVRGIHSPSHPLRVDRGPEEGSPWRVTLEGAKYQMNRDVVLNIDFAREHEPSVQIESGPEGESYLAVTFVPEFDEDELTATASRSDTVFVLDCSGSMQGDSIRQAVGALQILGRVIDERLVKSQGDLVSPDEMWDRFFVRNMRGIPTREYFLKVVLPRPRDLVFFVKAAVTKAINRKHAQVEEDDILAAEAEYSRFAHDILVVESMGDIEKLGDVLLGFAASNYNLNKGEITDHLEVGGIDPSKIDQTLDQLVSLGFLGLEVRPSEYEFAEDLGGQKRLNALARRVAETARLPQRYVIHPAFWNYLGVNQEDHELRKNPLFS